MDTQYNLRIYCISKLALNSDVWSVVRMSKVNIHTWPVMQGLLQAAIEGFHLCVLRYTFLHHYCCVPLMIELITVLHVQHLEHILVWSSGDIYVRHLSDILKGLRRNENLNLFAPAQRKSNATNLSLPLISWLYSISLRRGYKIINFHFCYRRHLKTRILFITDLLSHSIRP